MAENNARNVDQLIYGIGVESMKSQCCDTLIEANPHTALDRQRL